MTKKSPNPTSHSYFSERLRLHYLDWGNPDKPTMLLLHGVQDHVAMETLNGAKGLVITISIMSMTSRSW